MSLFIDLHIHDIGHEAPNHISAEQLDYFKTTDFGYLCNPCFSRNDLGAQDKHLDELVETVKGSEFVDKSVLLAMDKPYDKKVHFYVDNDYTLERVEKFQDILLFGASVSPARPNAIKALHVAKEKGAVLNKLLPNSQNINLSDPKYDSFWDTMRELGLPLLVHTGSQHTIIAYDNKYGDPSLLKNAADKGVTIILSHCGTPEYLNTTIEMMKHYSNVYGGMAAMARPSRSEFLLSLAENTEVHNKLVFESGLPAMPVPSLLGQDILEATKDIKNPLDVYCIALKKLGFPEDIFYRGAELLNLS